MGLFSNPMTLVDAAIANRVFEFRAQINEPGSEVGEYIEPAASVASDSKLLVKHTTAKNSGKKRHLIQRSEVFDLTSDPTDGNDSVVVNLTITHNRLATLSQVQNQLTLVVDAVSEANFLSKLMRNQL